MRHIIYKFFILTFLFSPLISDTNQYGVTPYSQMDTRDYIIMGVVMEISALFFSGAASVDPHVTGGILALTAPISIGMAGDGNTTKYVISLVAVESIAIYNLNIDTNKKSKNDIFIANLIAWNTLFASAFLADYLLSDPDESLSIRPISSEGVKVVYNYSF